MLRRLLLFAVALAACALAANATAATPVRPVDAPLLARSATSQERLAQSIARRLTGHQAVARCSVVHEAPGVWGSTPFLNDRPVGYFLLMPKACASLAAFRADPATFDPTACAGSCPERVYDALFALQTVAHESYHLLGFENEATAECYGMQALWYVARRLGAPVEESQALAALYWRDYPARRTSPHPEYWSAECRDGGKLDLRPGTHAWPS
ncbi:MAG TPA: hypothetical protein VGF23_08815 [Gaiellaceae bacterium]